MKRVGIGLIGIVIVLAGVVALVNYQAAGGLLIGTLTALIVILIINLAAPRRALVVKVSMAALLMAGIALGFVIAPFDAPTQARDAPPPPAQRYILLRDDAPAPQADTAVIPAATLLYAKQLTADLEADSARLTVDVWRGFEDYVGEETISLPLPARQTEQVGLFVRRVTVPPLTGTYTVMADGQVGEISLCAGGCPPTTMRFSGDEIVQRVTNATNSRTDGRLTVWQTESVHHPTTLTLVQNPAAALLMPLSRVSAWGYAVAGLIGGLLVLGIMFTPSKIEAVHAS